MAVSPDKSNDGFQYPSLNPAKCEFRLFTFHGRDEAGSAHGRLSTVSLEDKEVEFTALSYEWGDDAPTHRIILNSKAFLIRKNLHAFLQTFGQGSKRRGHGMFIDALCINQADQGERSSQVRLMPDIYSRAIAVCAWLGPMPDWWTSNPSLSDLWKIVPKREWGNFMFYLLTIRKPSSPLPFTMGEMREWASSSGLDNRTIVAARVAAQRAYARTPVDVPNGRHGNAPETVLRVSRAMSGHFKDVSEDTSNFVPAPLLGTGTDALSDGLRFQDAAVILSRKYAGTLQSKALPLHDLLEAFAMQQCREPRDHVFGLLGLCTSVLEPEYSIALPQLYMYALIEAHLHTQGVSSLSPLQMGFKAAVPAMEAFGWNMSHLTIHLITNQALQQSGKPPPILPLLLWNMSSTLNRKEWPQICRWAFESVQLVLLVVLPFRWWREVYINTGGKTPVVYAWLPTQIAYAAQAILIATIGCADWELAAPDGQIRTYSGWCREVERIAALVQNQKPLEPLSARETAECYAPGHVNLRRFKVNCVAFASAVVSPVAWTLSWVFLIALFYSLYRSASTILGRYGLARDALHWLPSWKVGLTVYVLYRIVSLRGMFPARLDNL